MTRQTAANILKMLPIIEAFANGLRIEFFTEQTNHWDELIEPNFDSNPEHYRLLEVKQVRRL